MTKDCKTCFWGIDGKCETIGQTPILMRVEINKKEAIAPMPFFEETGGDNDCIDWHPRLNQKQFFEALKQFQ